MFWWRISYSLPVLSENSYSLPTKQMFWWRISYSLPVLSENSTNQTDVLVEDQLQFASPEWELHQPNRCSGGGSATVCQSWVRTPPNQTDVLVEDQLQFASPEWELHQPNRCSGGGSATVCQSWVRTPLTKQMFWWRISYSLPVLSENSTNQTDVLVEDQLQFASPEWELH